MEILSAWRKHWPSNNSQETIFNRTSVYENRCVMIKKKNVFGRAYVNLTGFQAPKV